MTKSELKQVKDDIIKLLTEEAKVMFHTKDKDNQLRINGIAIAIKIIEKYNG